MAHLLSDLRRLYEYPLHLDPNASVMISIMDLIHKAVPDKNGSVIPANTRIGSFKVTSKSQDLRDGVTFVMSSGIYNPVSGTCCNSPITCHGEVSTYINPSPFTVAVGNTQGLHLIVNEDNGNILDYTSSASWSSASPNILTVQQGTGTATGFYPGSTAISAIVYGNVPVYIQNYCGYQEGGNQCPYGGAGANGTATVAPRITYHGQAINGKTQSVVVGQQIVLSVSNSGGQWNFGNGIVVGGFNTGNTGGSTQPNLSGINVTFYFVTGGTFTLAYSFNGVTASTTFTVASPVYQGITVSVGGPSVITSQG